MLRILKVWPRGYFSYGDLAAPLGVDDLGTVVLEGSNFDRRGNSNASGKSNFLNVVTSVLWNRTPKAKEDKDDGVINRARSWITNRKATRGAFGLVEYETLAGHFRIINCRKWREKSTLEDQGPSELVLSNQEKPYYHGSAVYFERWDGEMWRDLRDTSISATRRSIEESLPVSYSMFCSIAYQCQGRVLSFMAGGAPERTQILTDLIDYSLTDQAKELVRVDRRQLKDALIAMDEGISVREQQLDSSVVSEEELQAVHDEQAQLSLQLKVCASAATILVQYEAVVEEARAEREKALEGHRAEVLEQQRKLYEASTAKTSIATEVRHHETTLRHAVQTLSRVMDPRVKEADLAVRKAEAVRAAARKMLPSLTAPGRCPSCGTTVDAGNLEKHRKEVEAEIARKWEVVLKATAAKDGVEVLVAEETQKLIAEKTATKDAELARLAGLKGQWVEVEQQVQAALAASQGAIQAAASEPLDVPPYEGPARSEIDAQRVEVARRAGELDEWLKNVAEKEERQDALAREYRQAVARRLWKASEQQYLAVLEKHFGDRGLKSYKFGTLIGRLNDLMTEYLGILTDGDIRVSFSSYKVKKGAAQRKAVEDLTEDDIIPEFEIVVQDGTKDGVELSQYSGGEKQVIALALIFAFAQIASSQGTGVNVLMLDEIFGAVDETNVERVLELLSRLRDRIPTLFVVTHSAAVKALLRYDDVWTVTKRDGLSTITCGVAA